MPLWRSQQKNVYHHCMRCGRRQPLDKMRWQNGILICYVYDCVDKRIVGSRDIDVARQVSIYRHEQEPDAKLTQPTDRRADQNEILY